MLAARLEELTRWWGAVRWEGPLSFNLSPEAVHGADRLVAVLAGEIARGAARDVAPAGPPRRRRRLRALSDGLADADAAELMRWVATPSPQLPGAVERCARRRSGAPALRRRRRDEQRRCRARFP